MELGTDNIKSKKFWSQLLFLLGAIAAILSAMGAFGFDIYLASTQWILVGIFFAVAGIYVRLEE